MSDEEHSVSPISKRMEVPQWLVWVVAAAIAWGALGERVTNIGGDAATSRGAVVEQAALLSRIEEQILNLRVGVADVREAVNSLDREQASRFKAIEDRLLAEEEARRLLATQLDRLSTRVEQLVAGQIGVKRDNP